MDNDIYSVDDNIIKTFNDIHSVDDNIIKTFNDIHSVDDNIIKTKEYDLDGALDGKAKYILVKNFIEAHCIKNLEGAQNE